MSFILITCTPSTHLTLVPDKLPPSNKSISHILTILTLKTQECFQCEEKDWDSALCSVQLFNKIRITQKTKVCMHSI